MTYTTCPLCARVVSVQADGTLRKHKIDWPRWKDQRVRPWCEGSSLTLEEAGSKRDLAGTVGMR